MAKVLIGNFKGPKGDKGDKGNPGTAATIQVGTTQTVQPEENAEVTNSGTATAAVLNFKIPRGADGMTDLTAEYKDASEYTCQPTVNAPVVVKEVDGKTEQGADPSPDSPQVIKGTGGTGYFDGEWRQGSYSISGVPDNSGAWISFANKILCKANDNIKVSYDKDIVGIRIFFWNTSGGIVSSESIEGKETIGWTAPATAGSFTISFNDNNISPSTAAYCTVTINGEYQTGVEVHGANLIDANTFKNIFVEIISGAESSSNMWVSTDFVPINPSTEYYFAVGIYGNYVIFYDSNKQIIDGKSIRLDADKSLISPDNSSYFKLRFYNNDSTLTVSQVADTKPMVNEGSEPLPYQPYHHTALSIPLTSPLYEGDKICYVKPGDKYVNADGDTVTADGVLYGCYRENAVVVFDGSEDEGWVYSESSMQIYTTNTQYNIKNESLPAGIVKSDNFISGSVSDRNSGKKEIVYQGNGTVGFLGISSTIFTSLETAKTWLSTHPTTVLYKLAQPYFEPFVDQSIFYALRTDDTLSYVYSSDPIEPNITVDVAKNDTGGILLESYATAQKNALSEADNASRLASVEQQLLTLNTTVSTMGEAVSDLRANTYALKGGTAIPENADLNDYKTPGNYYCESDTTVATLQNCPVSHAFTLKVIYGNGVTYPLQIITDYSNQIQATRRFASSSQTWDAFRYLTPTTQS